jgi:hypothetical protein
MYVQRLKFYPNLLQCNAQYLIYIKKNIRNLTNEVTIKLMSKAIVIKKYLTINMQLLFVKFNIKTRQKLYAEI